MTELSPGGVYVVIVNRPPGTKVKLDVTRDGKTVPIELTLGLNDQLLLRNQDEVPQQFGPVLIMPGQSFRLPFEVASTYSFACTAHASGQMSVIVDPAPESGWPRLQWRAQRLERRWQAWIARGSEPTLNLVRMKDKGDPSTVIKLHPLL